jgi:hypothetical protein
MLLCHMQLHQCVRQFRIYVRHYFLMVSNAGIQLCLQVTVCICIIFFIFLHVVRRDMLLPDIQYGRFYPFKLTAGDRCQCGKQRRESVGYSRCLQCRETL